MFKIYLAGAMSHLTKEQRNAWRVKIVKEFFYYNEKIKVINPCKYYDMDMDANSYTEKEVKKFDLYQVRTSNIIIVNITHPNSIGTAMELQVASDLHIPIIAFGTPSVPTHPWILETIDKFCADIEDVINYVTQYYL